MTQPGTSPGYAMLAWRRAGGMEFLTDPDGNGQLNASVAGGTSSVPKWLKLSRRGDQVSAYWSNNGTTWTQIGTAATLADIGDTQDVGFFIMAHESAVRTADFSQFAVDSDPQEPEPEPQTPSEPLTCATGLVSRRVRLAGAAAQVGAAQRPGPADHPVGWLRSDLPVTTGDINEASNGPVSFAGQTVPAGTGSPPPSSPSTHSSHWQWAGLVVHQSDNEYNKIAFVRHQNGTAASWSSSPRPTARAPRLPPRSWPRTSRAPSSSGSPTSAAR